MSTTPLVSVILVCRDPGPTLAEALASVWAQHPASYELIVIDGGSRDGSAAWLAERQRQGLITHYVSEPDTGVYDAMNKGLRAAQGEWVLFLGADDRFADSGVLASMQPRLQGAVGEVVSGEARYSDGRIYRLRLPLRPARRNFVHHQATFYRRSLFERFNLFDARLRIAADYEFNLRLWCGGITFLPVDRCIAECRAGGLSDAGRWVTYREEIAVRHRHLHALACFPWDLGSVCRYLRKRMRRSRARVRPE